MAKLRCTNCGGSEWTRRWTWPKILIGESRIRCMVCYQEFRRSLPVVRWLRKLIT